MTEDRDEIIRRWKDEGVWDEVRPWLRNCQKRIKKATPTLTETQATAEAYALAVERWPSTEEDIVHIAANRGSMDVARDIAWAYEHLRDRRVRADQAPSGGAWSMLEYAQQVPHKFVELVARYDAQQKKQEAKTNEDFIADADEQIKEIDKLLAITEQIHADEIRDAIRQSPDEVVKVLRKAGWTVSRPED